MNTNRVENLQASNLPLNGPTVFPPPFTPGDHVPWFIAAADNHVRFPLSSLAGRTVVVAFVGSFTDMTLRKIASGFLAEAQRFSQPHTALLLVTADERDRNLKVDKNIAGVRILFDFDQSISRMYGCFPPVRDKTTFMPQTFLLDERLRVKSIHPVADIDSHARVVYRDFDRSRVSAFSATPVGHSRPGPACAERLREGSMHEPH